MIVVELELGVALLMRLNDEKFSAFPGEYKFAIFLNSKQPAFEQDGIIAYSRLGHSHSR